MTIGSTLAIFFVIWWTTLFAVLPFGVRSQAETGEVAPGSEPGAPSVTRLGRIAVINTLVAALVFAGFWFFLLPLL